MKFGILHTKTMTPRPGVKYSTVYYKQSAKERVRLTEFVKNTTSEVLRKAFDDEELNAELNESIGAKHKRKDGSYYTYYDVMADLLEQMELGRDITESMINRWNVAFEGTDFDINLVLESELKDTTFSKLFRK